MSEWYDAIWTGVWGSVMGLVGWYFGERSERRRIEKALREGRADKLSRPPRPRPWIGPPDPALPPKLGYRESARTDDCDHRAELLELRARIAAAERWHKCDEEKS